MTKKFCARILQIKLTLLFLMLGLPASNAANQWNLVWQDEFTSSGIDSNKWSFEVNATGGGNNELQFYTSRPQNAFVSNGKLTLRAIKENYTAFDPDSATTQTRSYTSARVNSRLKGDWTYGRFEALLKVPGDQGLWPAFWMLPTDSLYGAWAASGEIDIMEHRGDQPNTLFATIHYGDVKPNNTLTGTTRTGPDLSSAFHHYAIEWQNGEIRWYFDGTLYQTLNSWSSVGGAFPAPFDQPFHLLLNLAIGGDFLPDPPPTASYFPKDLTVDYVRVYQFSAGASADLITLFDEAPGDMHNYFGNIRPFAGNGTTTTLMQNTNEILLSEPGPSALPGDFAYRISKNAIQGGPGFSFAGISVDLVHPSDFTSAETAGGFLSFDARLGSLTAWSNWTVRLEDPSDGCCNGFENVNLPLTGLSNSFQNFTFPLSDFLNPALDANSASTSLVDLAQLRAIVIDAQGLPIDLSTYDVDLIIDNLRITQTVPVELSHFDVE